MLNEPTIYSSLDCISGYHHIVLSPKAQKKSAFVTLFGKFKFKKVPFGLAQTPAHFQQLINAVVKGLHFAFGYLVNVLIFHENSEKHLQHLKVVFDRLQTDGLKLKKELNVNSSSVNYII